MVGLEEAANLLAVRVREARPLSAVYLATMAAAAQTMAATVAAVLVRLAVMQQATLVRLAVLAFHQVSPTQLHPSHAAVAVVVVRIQAQVERQVLAVVPEVRQRQVAPQVAQTQAAEVGVLAVAPALPVRLAVLAVPVL